MACRLLNLRRVGDIYDQVFSDLNVLLHDFEFLFVELSHLAEDRVRYADLADIVEQGR